jgi:hypothetical protein
LAREEDGFLTIDCDNGTPCNVLINGKGTCARIEVTDQIGQLVWFDTRKDDEMIRADLALEPGHLETI